MKIPKYIIAREILLTTAVIVVSILFWLGMILYNKSNKKHLQYINKEIMSSQIKYDSFINKINELLAGNTIFEYLKKNNQTDLNEDEFIQKYSQPDSAKLIYDYFMQNKMTDLNFASFYIKYLSKKEAALRNAYKDSITIIKTETSELTAKQQKIERSIFLKAEINRYALNLFQILLVICYPVRIAITSIFWASKNYKKTIDKN